MSLPTAPDPSIPASPPMPALPRFPGRWIGSAAAATLLLGAWLAWSAWSARTVSDPAQGDPARAIRLAERIGHLEETLSLSARLAVTEDKAEWRDRHGELLSRLEASLADAIAAVPVPTAPQAAELAAKVRRRAVAFEIGAIERLRAGDAEAARRILDGAAYRLELEGRSLAARDLARLLGPTAEQRTAELNAAVRRTGYLAVAALGALVLGWAFGLGVLLRWRRAVVRSHEEQMRDAEAQFISYMRSFTRSMSMMTETLTLSARQLRTSYDAVVGGGAQADPVAEAPRDNAESTAEAPVTPADLPPNVIPFKALS